MIEEMPVILGIGGTIRADSSSERALAVAIEAARAEGARTVMFSGPQLVLPMYSPDTPHRTEEAKRLIDGFRRCDGIIISSAAYHGSISGMLKNALDYTEDLRSDQRIYLDGVAVGCIACAAGWQAAGSTLAAIRSIAHALRGWPTPLGATLNTSVKLFDAQANCTDLPSKFQLEMVGKQVVEFARMRLDKLTRMPDLPRQAIAETG